MTRKMAQVRRVFMEGDSMMRISSLITMAQAGCPWQMLVRELPY